MLRQNTNKTKSTNHTLTRCKTTHYTRLASRTPECRTMRQKSAPRSSTRISRDTLKSNPKKHAKPPQPYAQPNAPKVNGVLCGSSKILVCWSSIFPGAGGTLLRYRGRFVVLSSFPICALTHSSAAYTLCLSRFHSLLYVVAVFPRTSIVQLLSATDRGLLLLGVDFSLSEKPLLVSPSPM